MRLLLDQNLARIAALLRDAGHDAAHVAERGMSTAHDDDVFATSAAEDRVIVSEDTDFGARSLGRPPARRRSCSCEQSNRSGPRTKRRC